MRLRILAAGSRDLRDTPDNRAVIRELLLDALSLTTIGVPTLIHGAQRSKDQDTGEIYGADYLFEQVWNELGRHVPGGLAVERHAADWKRYGRQAGPIRNQEMVECGATRMIALPLGESRGTRDCIRRARHAGIPVVVREMDPSRASVPDLLDELAAVSRDLGLYDQTDGTTP